jgi:tetratricopeptide (TPR) repeat protein
LELNPKLINAAFAKAACENKVGRFEEAIETYNEAFALEKTE